MASYSNARMRSNASSGFHAASFPHGLFLPVQNPEPDGRRTPALPMILPKRAGRARGPPGTNLTGNRGGVAILPYGRYRKMRRKKSLPERAFPAPARHQCRGRAASRHSLPVRPGRFCGPHGVRGFRAGDRRLVRVLPCRAGLSPSPGGAGRVPRRRRGAGSRCRCGPSRPEPASTDASQYSHHHPAR